MRAADTVPAGVLMLGLVGCDLHVPMTVLPLLTRRLHLSKGQLVDVEGRLQTRQWDDDAGMGCWTTETCRYTSSESLT